MLTQILKLLHPFMPFITEEIWQALPHEGDYLMLQDWPVYDEKFCFADEERAMELVMDAIKAIRARRSEMNVPPSKKAELTVVTEEQAVFTTGIPFLKRLANASEVTVTADARRCERSGQRGHLCRQALHPAGGAGGSGTPNAPVWPRKSRRRRSISPVSRRSSPMRSLSPRLRRPLSSVSGTTWRRPVH